MAEVTVYTKERIDAILNQAVTSVSIVSGNLMFTLGDGSSVNAGYLLNALAGASTDYPGIIELATDVETAAGADSIRAITPFTLASLTSTNARKGLVELSTGAENTTGTDDTRAVTPLGMKTYAQPIDSDLTTIAGLTATTNNFVQSSGSAWASRTPAQAAATLGAVGMPVVNYSTGSGYSLVNVPAMYVGPTDPGAVVNGSIWYDTTGA